MSIPRVIIDGIEYVPSTLDIPSDPFPQLIFEARNAYGETLEEAADAIGTTKSHLWALEHGKCWPKLPLLQRILRHYRLSFGRILDCEVPL